MKIAKRITINTPTKIELVADLYECPTGAMRVCPIDKYIEEAKKLNEFGLYVDAKGEFIVKLLYMDLLTINETVFIND